MVTNGDIRKCNHTYVKVCMMFWISALMCLTAGFQKWWHNGDIMVTSEKCNHSYLNQILAFDTDTLCVNNSLMCLLFVMVKTFKFSSFVAIIERWLCETETLTALGCFGGSYRQNYFYNSEMSPSDVTMSPCHHVIPFVSLF